MSKSIVRASIITVDIKNSDEDIKNGGPSFLEYNYLVESSCVDSMLLFVTGVFNKLNIAYDYIYEAGYVFTKKSFIYDKEKIYKKIYNDFCNKQLENDSNNSEMKLVL